MTRAKSKSVRIVCSSCCSFDDKVNKLTNVLSNLSDRFTKMENRLTALENSTPSNQIQFEEYVQEANLRFQKSYNLIVYNLPESNIDNIDDTDKVTDIVDIFQPRYSNVIAVFRIGKADENRNKSRPLKIQFQDNNTPSYILRNKKKLQGTRFSRIQIKDDQTKYQINYSKNLREELERRKMEDEHLTIKYVNKIPTIVNTTMELGAKNY